MDRSLDSSMPSSSQPLSLKPKTRNWSAYLIKAHLSARFSQLPLVPADRYGSQTTLPYPQPSTFQLKGWTMLPPEALPYMIPTSLLQARPLCPLFFGFLTAVPGSPLSPLPLPSPLSPWRTAQPSHIYSELSQKSLPLTTISFLCTINFVLNHT